MNEAIKISNLSKSYGTHIVLNGYEELINSKDGQSRSDSKKCCRPLLSLKS